MEVFNLSPIQTAIMLGMVAGVVEFIKRAYAKEWKVCAIIFGAGVAGTLTALCIGINPLEGAVIGFAASGFITIAQNIGDNK